MNTDCLASTGVNLYIVIVIVALLIISGAFILARKYRKNSFFSLLLTGGIFAMALLPAHAVFADAQCPVPTSPSGAASQPSNTSGGTTPSAASASASPDTTTGVMNALQFMKVANNDTPSANSTFNLQSLKMSLGSSASLGAFVTPTGMIYVPGQGSYTILADGTIQFQPLPTFVGTAAGISYSLSDSTGTSVSSSYTPTVKGTVRTTEVTCSEITNGLTLQSREMPLNTIHLVGSVTIPYAPMAIATNGTSLFQGAYTSVDGGTTWQALPSKPELNQYINPRFLGGSADNKTLAYTINTTQGANAQILVSTDYGVTWNTTTAPNIFSGIVTSSGTIYYLDQPSLKIYMMSDGKTWQEIPTDPNIAVAPSSFAVSADGSTIVTYAGGSAISVSHDNGKTWSSQSVQGGTTNSWDSLLGVSTDGSYIVVQDRGNITSSKDGGASYQTYPSPSWMSPGLSTFAVKYAGTALIVADPTSAGMIQRSTDAGKTWTQIAVAPGVQFIDPIVVSSDGKYIRVGNYLSADNGLTWSQQPDGVLSAAQNIDPNTIDLDPSTPGIQTSVTYTSATSGASWTGTYDPSTDTFSYSTTASRKMMNFNDVPMPSYTANTPSGCSLAPASIVPPLPPLNIIF